MLETLAAGGRAPTTGVPPEDIPDPITEARLERHPRLDWSLARGLTIRPGASEFPPADGEETPDTVTPAWVNRQPGVQWSSFEGLRISSSIRR